MSDKQVKKQSRLGAEEWEAICERCGRCCYEKIDDRGTIYYTDTPCDRFDQETKLCTVYDHRAQARPDCLPLTPQVVAAGFLPADCPYVKGIKDYPAPLMGDEGKS